MPYFLEDRLKLYIVATGDEIKKKDQKLAIIIGASVGGALLLILIIVIIVMCCKKPPKQINPNDGASSKSFLQIQRE